MPTSSVGAISSLRPPTRRQSGSKRRRRGVTLIELLIVMTLIALVVGVSYPSAAAGIEALHLRSVADSVTGLLNTSVDRAARRQQVIEIWISPKDNLVIARSPDLAFSRKLEIPEPLKITAVLPPALVSPDEPRRFLLYPGGAAPGIGVEISDRAGRKRLVSMDPFRGLPAAPVTETTAPSGVRELH